MGEWWRAAVNSPEHSDYRLLQGVVSISKLIIDGLAPRLLISELLPKGIRYESEFFRRELQDRLILADLQNVHGYVFCSRDVRHRRT